MVEGESLLQQPVLVGVRGFSVAPKRLAMCSLQRSGLTHLPACSCFLVYNGSMKKLYKLHIFNEGLSVSKWQLI
jgi:hypothetical protein